MALGACSDKQNGVQNDACALDGTGTGCACDQLGDTVACGELVGRSAESVTCSVGQRTCTAQGWGACVGTHLAQQSTSSADLNGFHLQDLGGSTPCVDDPCNPNCVSITDNGGGLSSDGGLLFTEAGISLLGADASLDAGACKNLQCNIAKCDAGTHTTLTGTVYDPAGNNPLYNAAVYVPNAALPSFPAGVSTDQCNSSTAAASAAYTTTGSDGKFTLVDVPTGSAVPLVVEIGRWRRQVTVNVPACQTTAVAASLTHLPQNQSQGDMPQMAIATGSANPFECLLIKTGIDPAEFTAPTKTGRVHYYRENGVDTSPAAAAGSTLYGSLATLEKYNIVMLPCEGFEDKKSAANTSNVLQYADVGGRVFTTHFGYTWLWYGSAPWPTTATYAYGPSWNDPLNGYVDTSFPKGVAYSAWLKNVGASVIPGKVSLTEPRWNVNATKGTTQRWLYAWHDNSSSGSPDMVQAMTFNTPYLSPPASQYGRVVFTNFHVATSALTGKPTFPASCLTGIMTPQEKALEFLFFDIASCITPDVPPPPPAPPYTTPATFTRDYQGVCTGSQVPKWHWFDFGSVTPKDSSLVFKAQSATTQGALGAAPIVTLATVTGVPNAAWTGAADVDVKLQTIPQQSKAWLRITMILNPSSDGYSTPSITAWRQLYDCVDAL